MSLCVVSTEESRVKEELGRLSLSDSSSSLSILITRALATSGAGFIQTEYMFVVCMSNPQQADTGRK